MPHISYDFDGDGVVGEMDYFVGRMFDVEKKNYLTEEQRQKAIGAIRNEGWLDKFAFGFNKSGPSESLDFHLHLHTLPFLIGPIILVTRSD